MDAEALIRRANAAARSANSGSGHYAIYAGGHEQENTRRLALMGELRRAIERDELLLYCQPKAVIATRKICGAEALVRWKHPAHGMLLTGEFIKFAEQLLCPDRQAHGAERTGRRTGPIPGAARALHDAGKQCL
jgi:predicted signal transduction protein with EAL and GGDEF domain